MCWFMCIIVATCPLSVCIVISRMRCIGVATSPMPFCIVNCCIIRTLYMLSVTLTPHRAIVMKLVHTMVNVLGLTASERLGAV